MIIEWIKLKGFRNFKEAKVNFKEKTLIIGANLEGFYKDEFIKEG